MNKSNNNTLNQAILSQIKIFIRLHPIDTSPLLKEYSKDAYLKQLAIFNKSLNIINKLLSLMFLIEHENIDTKQIAQFITKFEQLLTATPKSQFTRIVSDAIYLISFFKYDGLKDYMSTTNSIKNNQ